MEHASSKAFRRFLVLASQFRDADSQEWLIFLQPSQQALGTFDFFV